MNYKIMELLAVGLMGTSMAANAPAETLYYQGSPLSDGTTISGSVVLNTPLGADVNANVIPASFSFPAIYIDSPAPGYIGGWGVNTYSFTFTTDAGTIVGWDINFALATGGGTNSPVTEDAVISNHGDGYVLQPSGVGCTAGPGQPDPCPPISGFNTTPGSWTIAAAPEIDPASAASGLMLLFGGVAVLRGRRKLES